MGGEGLGNFITWSAVRPSNVVTPPLNSKVIIWDCSCILCYLQRWDKRQQIATPSVWHIPRLKAMTPKGYWVTGVKIPSSDAIISWSESQHYLELPRLYHSHPSAVKLRTRTCFTGRAYLYSGTCFNSLASRGYECEYAFASRVCDISCAADHVMKFPRPSPSIFCILQVIKHWRCRRPGNEATNTWSGHTYACSTQGMMWICIPSTHHTVLV